MNKYIKKIKRYAKKNPEQSFLFLYNAGVYGWLQANVRGIGDLEAFVRNTLSWIPNEQIESVKNFFTTLPYGWLIISVVATILLKNLKKATRKLIMYALIGVGIYFMYVYAKASGRLPW